MREIRFRAWIKAGYDQCGGFMLYNPDKESTDYFMVSNGTGFAVVFDEEWLKDGDYDIMQFTGLLDKNGKEIFEGDIVKTKTNHFPRVNLEGVVVFEDAEYLIEQNDDSFPLCSFHVVDRLAIEVIGNIHENQDLLEGLS